MIFFLFITFICAIALAFLFLKKFTLPKFKDSRKIMIFVIAILLLPVFVLLFMKTTKGFIPLPMGVRHLIHRAISPEGLYEPIVTDNFLFYKKGFTRTYSLHPKYLDFYNIGFLVKNGSLSSKYKFSGKVKADFYWKNKLLFSKEITSHISAAYSDNDLKYFSDVLLLHFEIPFQGKYTDDISVKLTVLEPDKNLKQYGDSIRLFIGVSPTS